MRFRPPGVCPVCGDDVPAGARACPECGADERSGWKEDAELHDALDLPDEEFDYGDFVEKEFGDGPKKATWQRGWAIVAVIVLVALAALWLRGGF